MDKNNEDIGLGMLKCPVCNKMFIRPSQIVYKVYINGKYVPACSWSCVRKWEKDNNIKV